MNETETTLVLGGTGKTGRRVAQRLDARGLPVRIGSRSGTPPFDWMDRSTWEPALRDITAVYVTYQPDNSFPGATDAVAGFADLAASSGIRRLVMLSGRGGEGEVLSSEQAVRESALSWTILRASWFCQNFDEGFLLPPVLESVISVPAGTVAEPFVDAEDIADVAVAALTEDGHAEQVYELSGPRALGFAEVAAEISRAAGRPVRYQPIAPERYADVLAADGVPAEHATLLAELLAKELDGRNAYVTDGVPRVLGRPARDFTEYANRAAASGLWDTKRTRI